ncbi:hypothetical protein [Rhodobacter sp. SY28-1]|uniref:hypothetical protein n=1 Tax=Rhodobacter sp. SY28-1 TaxID=2562317 RepID=UPI0010BF73EB|nr:hypothetical protein [Rhodobacter sp. SY28-1]
MTIDTFAVHSACISLAILLFFAVNWIGRHAVSFGYSSTTLFEHPNESIALNFVFRTLPPMVLMVLLSAVAVASGNDELRLQSYWIAVYYFLIRAVYFPVFGLHQLIDWRRFSLHAGMGLAAAWAAYRFLILPKKSLLPDLETAGNELWLAMIFFMYALANSITVVDSRSAGRRNSFVAKRYLSARYRYGALIDESTTEDLLKLIVYSVIVFEDYCRPPIVRFVERTLFWRAGRTTGVMQVSSECRLDDMESVKLGTAKLKESWVDHKEESFWERVRSVVADYNRDDDYVYKVLEVMEIIAKRVEPNFAIAYESASSYQPIQRQRNISGRSSRVRRARYSQIDSPRRRKTRLRGQK